MGAVQFHFHTPSEHTVNGKNYDMELHLVTNSSVSGGSSPIAVIGLFFQVMGTSPRSFGHPNERTINEKWAVMIPSCFCSLCQGKKGGGRHERGAAKRG